MKRPPKASFTASISRRRSRGLFGIACLCVLALTAFLGTGAPAAGAAGACPNEEFRRGYGALLPDCRAYEQVSPVDKNGFDIGNPFPTSSNPPANTSPGAGGPVSTDGNAVGFISYGSFADASFGAGGELPYFARRIAGGWRTTALIPRPQGYSGGPIGAFISTTPDLQAALIKADDAPLTPGSNRSEINVFLRNNTSEALSFLFSAPKAGFGERLTPSGDFSHLAFNNQNILTSEPGQPAAPVSKVYEFHNGELRLVSREPGTNLPFQEGSAVGVPAFVGNAQSEVGAVSNDGDQIYFSAQLPSGYWGIFRRDNGTTTVSASPSHRTPVAAAGSNKIFRIATPDGERVFLTSAEPLTNDANTGSFDAEGDLYRYDISDDQLIDISAGTPGDEPGSVFGVLGISDSGSRVYYAAASEVVPGKGTIGQANLYLWEDDGTPQGVNRFIATLAPGTDADNWSSLPFIKSSQVTPDGRAVIFRSGANVTGYNPAGTAQTYIYRSDDGPEGSLLCLSCDFSGPPTDSSKALVSPPVFSGAEAFPPRAISNAGDQVVFSSASPLVSRDTNGKFDAYMWEAQGAGTCDEAGGCTTLLSTGVGSDDSYAYGLSASGDDAFFITRDSLLSQDVDTNSDLYTARVDGGLASQQVAVRQGCSGDGCQSAISLPPAATPPASARFESSGNVQQKPRARKCVKGKRKVKGRCVKQKHSQGKQRRGK